MKALEVSREYYVTTVNQLSDGKRAYLDEDIRGDKYYLVFEGLAVGGFVTNKSGYLGGVFTLKRGIGRRLIAIALKHQKALATNRDIELCCIGQYLRKLYEDFGFYVTESDCFKDEYANYLWDYNKYGRPTVYTMTKHGRIGEI